MPDTANPDLQTQAHNNKIDMENLLKNVSHFGHIGWIIFIFHLFMSFASSESLENAFTFPLMHWMILYVRSDADGPSDLGIGLLMYPTMILNSLAWSFLMVIVVRLFIHAIQKRRREFKAD